MRNIIRVQNAVISGLVTVMAIMTGFYEVHGLKLVVIAMMGFFVLNAVLLEIERAYLRGRRNEGKRKEKGAGGSVPGVWWYKMRFRLPVKTNRDPGGNITAIQTATRNNAVRAAHKYR